MRWQQAGPIVGVLITMAILGVFHSAVRHVGARFIDVVHPGPRRASHQRRRRSRRVLGSGELRIGWMGLTLTAAHEIAHHAEAHLRADV